jgi:hypothetical protein
MTGTPPLSPKGATTKDKAAIAGHVDQSASATLTGVQQDEVAARLATETASAAALERQKAYGAALARLAKAEEEARVAASAATPPWRAQIGSGPAKAAAAALATPHDDGASSVPTPVDLHRAMLLQEAAALLNLHAQAVAVNNI